MEIENLIIMLFATIINKEPWFHAVLLPEMYIVALLE